MGGRGSTSRRANTPVPSLEQRESAYDAVRESLGVRFLTAQQLRQVDAILEGGGDAERAVENERKREQANAEASKRLRSAKAPSRGKPIEVTNADGEKGIILRATPGYRTGDRTGDTMYDVRILNADGKEVWRTTRRGSGALPRAKDDVALQLGLQRVKHQRTRWEYGEV